MPEESAGIPLVEILRTANELVSSGLIKDYALGGALAAMRYVEPLATYHADIFFIPAAKDLWAGVHDIYEALRARGCEVELRQTGERFAKAQPEHNPNDTAMSKVIISLPRPVAQ